MYLYFSKRLVFAFIFFFAASDNISHLYKKYDEITVVCILILTFWKVKGMKGHFMKWVIRIISRIIFFWLKHKFYLYWCLLKYLNYEIFAKKIRNKTYDNFPKCFLLKRNSGTRVQESKSAYIFSKQSRYLNVWHPALKKGVAYLKYRLS
jgi:hypothetical protein